jgi:hypothetical protein
MEESLRDALARQHRQALKDKQFGIAEELWENICALDAEEAARKAAAQSPPPPPSPAAAPPPPPNSSRAAAEEAGDDDGSDWVPHGDVADEKRSELRKGAAL